MERVSVTGSIVTGARRERVPSEFEPALAAARERVAGRSAQASLYLYGSVATGQARVPSADVDLLTIELDADVARAVAHDLTEQFRAVCRGVEIGAALESDFQGDTDEVYGNRVFLRHYCVHISGPARHGSLPEFPADVRAARGFNGDIALHAARWRSALDEGGDHAALARRIARKSLLAVAGLVSVHDRTWTTDRTSSARRWAEIEPDLRRDLDALVTWSDGDAAPSRREVRRVLTGTVDALVQRFATDVGLWR